MILLDRLNTKREKFENRALTNEHRIKKTNIVPDSSLTVKKINEKTYFKKSLIYIPGYFHKVTQFISSKVK